MMVKKGLRAAVKRYFLTGLLVITPIWGTVLILWTLFDSVDGLVREPLRQWITEDYYYTGFGVLTLIVFILLVGLLAATLIGHRIVRMWEDFLQRVPVVRGIYATI